MDETWAHHFDPETKQQSKQWKHVTSSTPVNFCKIASAGKVTASVFWHIEGVLMIDYLERGNSSRRTPPRPQIALPHVPWPDESHTQLYLGPMTHTSQVYLGPMSHTPKCTLTRCLTHQSAPWSDDSHSQVYLDPMSHTPKCTLAR